MNSTIPTQPRRRCIGRKPVTDFQVGSIHSGKIVYIKPTLGIFIDINCHSDAFCHISEIPSLSNNNKKKKKNDTKNKDDNEDQAKNVFSHIGNVGDVIHPVQILSIHRKKKQITVTLRTDRVVEVPLDNNDTNHNKTISKDEGKKEILQSTQHTISMKQKNESISSNRTRQTSPSSRTESMKNPPKDHIQNHNHDTHGEKKSVGSPAPQEVVHSDHSNNRNHNDLKRQRKLERRAQRRTLAIQKNDNV